MNSVPPVNLSDNELLQLIADGNLHAFEQLMLRYENIVFSFMLKFLKSDVLAEELTQDIFIDLWNNRHKVTHIDSLPAWLYTVSRNKSLNSLKEIASRQLREEKFASSSAVTADLEQDVLSRNYEQLVNEIVNQLPQKRREIFRLKTEYGFTNEEIGAQLHISSNTVKNQLTKSHQFLRKEISKILSILLFLFLTGK